MLVFNDKKTLILIRNYSQVPDTKQWFVYMLECADGSLYTGVSNDLAKRVEKHNAGKGAKYTRSRLPVKLVYSETAPDKGEALKKEIKMKQLSRAEKLVLIRQGAYSC
ncbi:MAG: GIY-YIG nuclease family protein [Gammaproteobacteria bacterium]|nr:GIY-YIG nuclease family protein [Gammaproteobacteria bacterium]